MIPRCYMLLYVCPCVYGLKQYGHVNAAALSASYFVLFRNVK